MIQGKEPEQVIAAAGAKTTTTTTTITDASIAQITGVAAAGASTPQPLPIKTHINFLLSQIGTSSSASSSNNAASLAAYGPEFRGKEQLRRLPETSPSVSRPEEQPRPEPSQNIESIRFSQLASCPSEIAHQVPCTTLATQGFSYSRSPPLSSESDRPASPPPGEVQVPVQEARSDASGPGAGAASVRACRPTPEAGTTEGGMPPGAAGAPDLLRNAEAASSVSGIGAHVELECASCHCRICICLALAGEARDRVGVFAAGARNEVEARRQLRLQSPVRIIVLPNDSASPRSLSALESALLETHRQQPRCELLQLLYEPIGPRSQGPTRSGRNATDATRSHSEPNRFMFMIADQRHSLDLPEQILVQENVAATGGTAPDSNLPLVEAVAAISTGVAVVPEFLAPHELQAPAAHYASNVEPTRAKLVYFFIQQSHAPSEQDPGIFIRRQITRAQAQEWMREVTYNRGIINNRQAREALVMRDGRERLETFKARVNFNSTSGLGQSFTQPEVLQLVCLGYFVSADSPVSADPTALTCCFCICSLLYGPRAPSASSTYELPQLILQPQQYSQSLWLASEAENRVASLKRRHTLFSPTCPVSIGVAGDNRQLTPQDILLYTRAHIYFYNRSSQDLANLSLIPQPSLQHRWLPHNDMAAAAPAANASTAMQLERDGENNTSEGSVANQMRLANYVPPLEPINDMIGQKPSRPDLLTLESREKTFEDQRWRDSLSRENIPPYPLIAEAGFYYTGEGDNVRCFWCALGLNNWEPTDVPWREHARFSPKCPWVIRCKGRHFIRQVLMDETNVPLQSQLQRSFIMEQWEELHGGLEVSTIPMTNFKIESREFKARMDWETYRAFEELGFKEQMTEYANECYLRDTGDDPSTAQEPLVAIWEYCKQMVTHGLFDPYDYLARCRHQRMLLVDELHALRPNPQSDPSAPPNHPVQATFSPQSYSELPPPERLSSAPTTAVAVALPAPATRTSTDVAAPRDLELWTSGAHFETSNRVDRQGRPLDFAFGPPQLPAPPGQIIFIGGMVLGRRV